MRDRFESVNTVFVRKYQISKFKGFLELRNKNIIDADGNDVDDYRRYLLSTGNAPASINNTYYAIKSFYDKRLDDGEIVFNPCMNIKPFNGETVDVKRKRFKESLLSKQELCELKIKLGNDKSPEGLRDYAIFITLLKTGISANELALLKWSDVIYSHVGSGILFEDVTSAMRAKYISVRGRRNKRRDVEIDASVFNSILNYHKNTEIQHDYMFSSHEKSNRSKYKFTDRFWVHRLVKGIGDKIGRNISPNNLRDTHISILLSNGIPPHIISIRLSKPIESLIDLIGDVNCEIIRDIDFFGESEV